MFSGVDLDMASPGLYCVIGPNGVGKSTLIKCINGLLEPDGGEVLINGRNSRDYSIREMSDTVAYVPAAASIAFPMSVVDSLLIGMESGRGIAHDMEDVATAYRALHVMRMDGLAIRGCDELSAGQMQKASICRGLVRRRGIILLDEPTSNLDVKHQLFVGDFFAKLAHRTGSIVMMISHDLNIAAKYADKVAVMAEPGMLYAYGTPSEVVTERMIHDVYGVKSKIIDVDGRPHVILDSAEDWRWYATERCSLPQGMYGGNSRRTTGARNLPGCPATTRNRDSGNAT